MESSERIVGLVIVVTSPTEMVEISEQMEVAGFRVGDEAIERNAGIRSRLMPIAGGGFIELASELSPGSFTRGPVFETTPRVLSVSYTTEDAAQDLRRWRGVPGTEHASVSCGSWQRQDGTPGYYVGVAPTPPTDGVLIGLREVRLFPLPYADEAATAPAVRRVTVSGNTADVWRERHAQLFQLPERDGVLHAGDTELIFEQHEGAAELKVTVAVPNPEVSLSIAHGGLEFVAI